MIKSASKKFMVAMALVSLLAVGLPLSARADSIDDPYINLTNLNGSAATFLTTFAPTAANQDHFSQNTLGVSIFNLQVTATTTAGNPFANPSSSYVCNSALMPAGHGTAIPSCTQVSFSTTQIVFLWTGLGLAPGAQFDWVTGPTTTAPTSWTDHTTFSVQANVPEPASMLLLGTGLVGLAGVIRRKLHR